MRYRGRGAPLKIFCSLGQLDVVMHGLCARVVVGAIGVDLHSSLTFCSHKVINSMSIWNMFKIAPEGPYKLIFLQFSFAPTF